jgi:hypothetical protein
MDVVNQKRQQAQQTRNNERQDRLDQAQSDQLERQNTRQDTSDTIAAAQAGNADIANELRTHAAAGTKPTPERQAVLASAVRANQAALSKARATYGGADLDQLTQQYAKAQKDLENGSLDPASMSDTDFGNTIAQGVKRPLGDFKRGDDGAPSPVEQAGQHVIQGIQSGDTQSAVAGLNFLQKPSIDRIIGHPSPHGGTIVGAQIADLHLDPQSQKDDPHYIPMLKVWVNDGKQRQDSGDLAHPTITSDEAQGAPAGATGHYFAPVTEDRSSSDTAKIMRFSMKDGLEFIGHNMHLAELLNSPEAQQKLQRAYANPGQTPDDYLNAMLGIMPPKKSMDSFTLKPGDVRVDRDLDARGRPIAGSERRIEGSAKPQTLVQKAEQAAQDNGTEFADEYAKLRAANKGGETKDDAIARIEADNTLSASEKKAAKIAVMSGIKPGKYTGSGLSGGGGGKSGDSGGTGLSAADNRRLQRLNDSLKQEQDSNKEDKQEALRIYEKEIAATKDILNMKAAATAKAAAETKYNSTLSTLKAKDADIAKRRARVQDQLEGGTKDAEPGLPAPKPSAGGKPGAGLSREDAAKKFGF